MLFNACLKSAMLVEVVYPSVKLNVLYSYFCFCNRLIPLLRIKATASY